MFFPLGFGSGYGFGLYFLFALPALLLGFYAQMKVQGAFNKYSKVKNPIGLTGAEVARRILDSNGLHDVQIQQVNGTLSDNYDPSKRVLRLSQGVYGSNSVAAAGVAAHESGHALQHQQGYALLNLRTAMVPTVQIGSWLGPIIFIIGLFMAGTFGTQLAWIGVILFGASALFALVTLPVELDASRRAKVALVNGGLVYQSEMQGVNSVLNAAALTYVAAAIQAISTILYYVFLLSGSRRR
jgi:Zn-dependent membrane protease YugP